MFELARSVATGGRKIALFTTLSERQVATKRDSRRVLPNIDIFSDNAGSDLNFVLGQIRYGKPILALVEVPRTFLTRTNLDQLRQTARINKASVICVVSIAKHERIDAEEAAERAAARLADPEDIPEL
jgi:hypothetical protein